MLALTKQEIMIIVNQYIGVSGGYLGDFTYRTHADFYLEYCNLDIDPEQYPGTTRGRFIAILENSPQDVQAKILRGVFSRFPIDAVNKPISRTSALQNKLLTVALRLEGASLVTNPKPRVTSQIVEQAIADVENSIQAGSAVSGVDRIHTALHGYLRAVCDSENISYNNDDAMTKLFKMLRQQHPAFQNLGPRSQDIERILQAFATIMDALNPIRNTASIAHPNVDLLSKDESMLVINAARTLLHYLDAKFG